MRRLLTCLLVAMCAAIVAAGSAVADVSGRVTNPSADASGEVTFALTAPSLPSGSGLDPSTVQVRVDGRLVPTTATPIESRQVTGASTSAMLVVDTSGSMKGRGIVAARKAARGFLKAAPPEVKIGLETFADQPQIVAAPTIHRRGVSGGLHRLRPRGETALYDALLTAAENLGRSGQRRVIVVSDGADTVSHIRLAAAVDVLTHQHIAVEVVGLQTVEADSAVLRRLATATGGRFVLAGNGAALAEALRSSARSYATKLTVRSMVPPALWGAERHLTVTADSSAGVVTAAHTLTIGRVAQQLSRPATRSEPSPLLWEGLVAIALALLLGSLALFGGDTGTRRRTRKLVGRYSITTQAKRDPNEGSAVARAALGLADRVVQSRGLNDRLALRLTRAGMSLTPSEWLLLQAGAAFATVLLFGVLGMAAAVAVVVGGIAGPLLGHLFLGIRASRRRAAFVAALPDTLQLIAGSLSAGYSLAQSLDGVVGEGAQPIAGELGRALAESRLGVPIENTLESVAERMDSEDFRWVVLAIQIQHQVGGNLAEVLMTVASTMRERVQLHRHVRALSAEGRLSAYILVGLPVFFTLYLGTVQGDYLRPLYTTKMGFGMIAVGLVLLAIGSVVMKKTVKVEV